MRRSSAASVGDLAHVRAGAASVDRLPDEGRRRSRVPRRTVVDAAPEPILPEPVRQRVIALAAAALPGLPVDELPVPLRRVAKFAPNRRARLGGPAIAAAARRRPALPAAGRRPGRSPRPATWAPPSSRAPAPAAADPVEVAALAYLARPAGWRDLVDGRRRGGRAPRPTAPPVAELVRDAEQRAARAEHDRAVARVEADKLRDELARVREELGQLREEARRARPRRCARRRPRERKASEHARHREGPRRPGPPPTTTPSCAGCRPGSPRRRRRPAPPGRRAKEARAVDDARLWLLLETIGQAAVGLRRELALEPDRRAAGRLRRRQRTPTGPARRRGQARALDADDPARLDQLLALPRAHLVVDGYNVTKRGFGEMSLEQQRNRLITGLGGHRRADRRRGHRASSTAPSGCTGCRRRRAGVRVLFSRKGETADELIRRLVRAEPAGPAGGRGLLRPRGRRRRTPARRLPARRRLAAAPARPLLTATRRSRPSRS